MNILTKTNFASADEAMAHFGADFEVFEKPLFLGDGSQLKSHKAIHGNGGVLGVVGSRYNPVQNRDALSLLDNLFTSPTYTGGGILEGGKKAFIIADFGEFSVGSGDPIRKQVMLYNSHDGSGAVKATYVPFRVFCSNQVSMMLKQERLMSFRHTSSAQQRLIAAQSVAHQAIEGYCSIESIFNEMEKVEISQVKVDKALDLFWEITPDLKPTGRTRRSNNRELVQKLLEEGRGARETRKSGWALYNAFSEYFTHHGSRSEESRLANRLIGTSVQKMKCVEDLILA